MPNGNLSNKKKDSHWLSKKEIRIIVAELIVMAILILIQVLIVTLGGRPDLRLHLVVAAITILLDLLRRIKP
jgi:hypothetical protein